jgi:cystathionine beta-lyase/cystathionine gamma-synthase
LGWGGINTLIRPYCHNNKRIGNTFEDPNRVYRMAIGLENPEILIEDLNNLANN